MLTPSAMETHACVFWIIPQGLSELQMDWSSSQIETSTDAFVSALQSMDFSSMPWNLCEFIGLRKRATLLHFCSGHFSSPVSSMPLLRGRKDGGF